MVTAQSSHDRGKKASNKVSDMMLHLIRRGGCNKQKNITVKWRVLAHLETCLRMLPENDTYSLKPASGRGFMRPAVFQC